MIVNSVSYLIYFCQPNLFIFALKDGIFEPKTLVNFSVEDKANLLRWNKQLHNFFNQAATKSLAVVHPQQTFHLSISVPHCPTNDYHRVKEAARLNTAQDMLAAWYQ